MEVEFSLKAFKAYENCRVNCTIFSSNGTPIGSNTSFNQFPISTGEKRIKYTIKAPNLATGTYSLSFSVGTGNTAEGETNFDVIQNILSLEIDKFSTKQNLYFAKWDSNWGNIFINTSTQVL